MKLSHHESAWWAVVIVVIAMTSILAWRSLWAAEEQPPTAEPRTLVVALDGSGEYTSIQEAIDKAQRGDTIRIKAGQYREDVTIHSKQRLKLVGDGVDQVTILGRERVGVFHIGKWPYGATEIEISGLTINEHGGHAMGIFNGRTVVLRGIRINGMVFGQQVQDVQIENSVIGGSETTGVQFADSQAVLIGNTIQNNDHGVTIAGRSDVRLERNVITGNLYEGVVVTDHAKAVLISNTIVKNGGGIAFLGSARGEASGNILGLNRVGFLIGSSSRVALSYNALYNREHDYLKSDSSPIPAPELKPDTDVIGDPRFVDPVRNDFRLKADSPLLRKGSFAYLGALSPLNGAP